MMRITDPDSAVTRLRDWLSRKIAPSSVPGEAWCMRCELNNGRTLIVSADGWTDHVRRHHDLPGTHYVSVRASWPKEDRSP